MDIDPIVLGRPNPEQRPVSPRLPNPGSRQEVRARERGGAWYPQRYSAGSVGQRPESQPSYILATPPPRTERSRGWNASAWQVTMGVAQPVDVDALEFGQEARRDPRCDVYAATVDHLMASPATRRAAGLSQSLSASVRVARSGGRISANFSSRTACSATTGGGSSAAVMSSIAVRSSAGSTSVRSRSRWFSGRPSMSTTRSSAAARVALPRPPAQVHHHSSPSCRSTTRVRRSSVAVPSRCALPARVCLPGPVRGGRRPCA